MSHPTSPQCLHRRCPRYPYPHCHEDRDGTNTLLTQVHTGTKWEPRTATRIPVTSQVKSPTVAGTSTQSSNRDDSDKTLRSRLFRRSRTGQATAGQSQQGQTDDAVSMSGSQRPLRDDESLYSQAETLTNEEDGRSFYMTGNGSEVTLTAENAR